MINFFLSHLYITLVLIILVSIWLPIVLFDKRDRRWILIMSAFGAFIGLPIITSTFTKDWWCPQYMYPNLYIKFEDIIFAFTLTGLMTALYLFFKRKESVGVSSKNRSYLLKAGAVVLVFGVFLGLINIFNFHSFYASIVSAILAAVIGYINKIRYLKYAIYTGLTVCIIYFVFYEIALFLNPEIISSEWQLTKLSGYFIRGVPIEEYVWFFLSTIEICAFKEIFDDNK